MLTAIRPHVTDIVPGQPALMPRFNANRRVTGLNALAKHCAYCGDTFSHKPHGTTPPNPPTFDHIRPLRGAKGPTATQNGVLACKPCNNARRGNIPLLEFLMGEDGPFVFLNGGDVVLKGDLARSFLMEWADIKTRFNRLLPQTQTTLTPPVPGSGHVSVTIGPISGSTPAPAFTTLVTPPGGPDPHPPHPLTLAPLPDSSPLPSQAPPIQVSPPAANSAGASMVLAVGPTSLETIKALESQERQALEQKYTTLQARLLAGEPVTPPVQIRPQKPPGPLQQAEKQREIKRRIQSFSRYMKTFVKHRYRISPYQPRLWYTQALDHMLYPAWKAGSRPTDPKAYEAAYRSRLKLLFQILAQADPRFWLSNKFKRLVQQDFPKAADDPRGAMILGVLSEISQERKAQKPLEVPLNPFRQSKSNSPGAQKRAM